MENDILDSLNDLGYEGPLSDEVVLAKALEGGPKSLEYTKLIHILAEELKKLCQLEETVNMMSDPDESSSFLLELSSFLKELGCPYKNLVTGHMSSRLQTKEDRVLLLDYLISELMAARMVQVDRPKEKTASTMDIVVQESPTARDLKEILIALKFNKPPPNITPEMLFSKLEAKLKDTIQKDGEQLVGKPLYNKAMTEKEWKELDNTFNEMFEEYRLRRETLITRLECTIQSFEWSDRLKTKKDLIQSTYRPKREQMKVKPDVRLSDFLAARTSLLQVEKTSNANVRKNTQTEVNKVIIGQVPDRGGRPNEQQPPPPEMPSWQQRAPGQVILLPNLSGSLLSGRHFVPTPEHKTLSQLLPGPKGNFLGTPDPKAQSDLLLGSKGDSTKSDSKVVFDGTKTIKSSSISSTSDDGMRTNKMNSLPSTSDDGTRTIKMNSMSSTSDVSMGPIKTNLIPSISDDGTRTIKTNSMPSKSDDGTRPIKTNLMPSPSDVGMGPIKMMGPIKKNMMPSTSNDGMKQIETNSEMPSITRKIRLPRSARKRLKHLRAQGMDPIQAYRLIAEPYGVKMSDMAVTSDQKAWSENESSDQITCKQTWPENESESQNHAKTLRVSKDPKLMTSQKPDFGPLTSLAGPSAKTLGSFKDPSTLDDGTRTIKTNLTPSTSDDATRTIKTNSMPLSSYYAMRPIGTNSEMPLITSKTKLPKPARKCLKRLKAQGMDPLQAYKLMVKQFGVKASDTAVTSDQKARSENESFDQITCKRTWPENESSNIITYKQARSEDESQNHPRTSTSNDGPVTIKTNSMSLTSDDGTRTFKTNLMPSTSDDGMRPIDTNSKMPPITRKKLPKSALKRLKLLKANGMDPIKAYELIVKQAHDLIVRVDTTSGMTGTSDQKARSENESSDRITCKRTRSENESTDIITCKQARSEEESQKQETLRVSEDSRLVTSQTSDFKPLTSVARPSAKTLRSFIDSVNIRVGICNTEPMSDSQLGLVKRSIIQGIIDDPDNVLCPIFESCSFKLGWLQIIVKGERSREWLENRVKVIKPWPEANLSLISENQFPKDKIGVVFVPKTEIESPEDALLLLGKQNVINTSLWKILRVKYQNDGCTVILSIDDASLEILRKLDFKLQLGFKKVLFRM